MKRQEILKLNRSYFPVAVANWKTVMTDIVSGSVFPFDIAYETTDGYVNKSVVESMSVVKTFEEWSNLPIRDYDDFVNSSKQSFRLPIVVICTSFDKIVHSKVEFPTKSNIWKRDNFTCAYSGKKLTRDTISTDHIMPKSRGGENSWENLITCSKDINVFKADRTPKEAGLSLLFKPYKPKNGIILREEWNLFLNITFN